MQQIREDIKLDFSDVLIEPQRSTLKSRKEVNLEREFTFLHSKTSWKGIPIISANMDTTGTFEIAEALQEHKMLTAIHKHYSIEEWKAFINKHKEKNSNIFNHIMVSTGTSDKDFDKITEIIAFENDLKFICIDIANGYSEHLADFVKKARKSFPDKIIIAGNVVTGDMTAVLLMAGADIVKVGIGPGSVCTTRKMTGIGYPQLSAIIECQNSAHGLGGHVISDGGCSVAGDVSKAFGADADFVMLGGMLAGHSESGGELIEKDGIKYKRFYGMSSKEAMKKHSGGVANYRASEGKSVDIEYRGSIHNTVTDVLGGVRSTCTYVGARKLKDLSKCTTFIRVNRQLNNIFS
jgi:GMP reductase